jgi:hypothetical protein
VGTLGSVATSEGFDYARDLAAQLEARSQERLDDQVCEERLRRNEDMSARN